MTVKSITILLLALFYVAMEAQAITFFKPASYYAKWETFGSDGKTVAFRICSAKKVKRLLNTNFNWSDYVSICDLPNKENDVTKYYRKVNNGYGVSPDYSNYNGIGGLHRVTAELEVASRRSSPGSIRKLGVLNNLQQKLFLSHSELLDHLGMNSHQILKPDAIKYEKLLAAAKEGFHSDVAVYDHGHGLNGTDKKLLQVYSKQVAAPDRLIPDAYYEGSLSVRGDKIYWTSNSTNVYVLELRDDLKKFVMDLNELNRAGLIRAIYCNFGAPGPLSKDQIRGFVVARTPEMLYFLKNGLWPWG